MWREAVVSLLVSLVLYASWFPAYSDDKPDTGAADYFGHDGYRIEKYRAPTPATTPHGITVNTKHLQELMHQQDLVLLDVQAVAVRPETEEFGISWLPAKQRFNLPGSVWLPNVGYGQLEKRMDAYFRFHLHRLTRGDFDHPVVIYCVLDCWMSWNAIRRAAAYGYRRLYWYPLGTDGWAAQGLRMQKAKPVPLSHASER